MIKEKSRKQEAELLQVNAKFRETSERNKTLERSEQLHEMALAGLRNIKDESAKELIKLNTQINTMKLDLLAERQLRRLHQTTLHKLDPGNENYDVKSVTVDENPAEPTATNYNITPFWQLNPEATKKETKPDRPYLIPSKIQKANDNKLTTKKADNPVTKKRSSSRDETPNNGPSTSSNTIRFSFAENSNAQTSAPNSVDNNEIQARSTYKFNFGNPGSTNSFSSLFRFGNTSTPSAEPSTSQQPAPSAVSNRLNLYRDTIQKDMSNPRSSDR